MLFAKISPEAEIVKQTTPFAHDIKNCEYMTASANPYTLGSSETYFTIFFGNFNVQPTDGSPALPIFEVVYSTTIKLSADELAAWGTDDREALTVISDAINTTITEYKDVPDVVSL